MAVLAPFALPFLRRSSPSWFRINSKGQEPKQGNALGVTADAAEAEWSAALGCASNATTTLKWEPELSLFGQYLLEEEAA